MMNLNDIIQAAQGGQGVSNLASQFGLTPEQTQAALQAMMPAFSGGLQNAAQTPGGLGGLLSQMTSGAHQGSFADSNQASAATGPGGNVLGQIFGSQQVSDQISQHAAQMSGISPQIIAQMMPVVASMLMGGLFHSMNSQGMGSVLSQLASAATAPGGLGSMFGQPSQAGAPAAAGGMFGGMLGNLLGGLMGGGAQPAGANPQAAAMQAGMNALTNMFQAGVQVSQAHQQGLSDILNSLTARRT